MNPLRFVLLVEDCDDAVAALQIALEVFCGCRVHHVADGEQAWRALRESSEAPLAIVTDLNLPGMDGYELIQQVRADPRMRYVPVMVISAEPDPRAPERVRALGADAFFSKPYSPSGICHCLENILHAKHEMLTADRNPGDRHAGGDAGSDRDRF